MLCFGAASRRTSSRFTHVLTKDNSWSQKRLHNNNTKTRFPFESTVFSKFCEWEEVNFRFWGAYRVSENANRLRFFNFVFPPPSAASSWTFKQNKFGQEPTFQSSAEDEKRVVKRLERTEEILLISNTILGKSEPALTPLAPIRKFCRPQKKWFLFSPLFTASLKTCNGPLCEKARRISQVQKLQLPTSSFSKASPYFFQLEVVYSTRKRWKKSVLCFDAILGLANNDRGVPLIQIFYDKELNHWKRK